MRDLYFDGLREMARAARGKIDRIFLHWSAGHYGQPFTNYHINIDKGGELYTDAEDLSELKAHTWQQNRRSAGIALLCCAFATPDNLGKEPPTEHQIEAMAQVVAVLCQELDIRPTVEFVRTHAEQADIDGYGPATTYERWDMWILRTGDEPGSGGPTIRGKAIYYMINEFGGYVPGSPPEEE